MHTLLLLNLFQCYNVLKETQQSYTSIQKLPKTILRRVILSAILNLMVKVLHLLGGLFYLMVSLLIFPITGKFVMGLGALHRIYPLKLFLKLHKVLLTMLEKIVMLLQNLIIFLAILPEELP